MIGPVKDPIFIIGLHRSGSTLWHNLVAMSPGICRLTDPCFLGAWWQRDFRYFLARQVGDLSRNENVDRLVELMFSRQFQPGLEGAFWRFENFEFVTTAEFRGRVSDRIKESNRTLTDIARCLLDELCARSGSERICVKFPVDVSHVPRLLEWYPGCRIMHISRDPRAVSMSKTNDPSGTARMVRRYSVLSPLIRKEMMLFAAYQYIRASRFHRRFQGLRNYRLFLYEDLLANPEETVRSLFDFIGAEFSPEVLRLERSVHEHQPSSLTGERHKRFDREAAHRWQQLISPFDRRVVTTLTRGSMARFGYHPEDHPVFEPA